jgi:hypothetical protein
MNDFFNLIQNSDLTPAVGVGNPTPVIILFIIIMSFAVGMFVGFIYMWTHDALSYSRTFVVALGMMPMIVAMLMLAMSNNIFVAFGLLGVFGAVRFRNVHKDTRDTIFILWVIMEGVAIGTTRFSTAAMAALGVAAAFICYRFIAFGTRRRYDAVLSLRVTGDVSARLPILTRILNRHATRLDLASDRRATNEGTDMTYRLLLRDVARSNELQSELASAEGFANVSVYMHEDEAEL